MSVRGVVVLLLAGCWSALATAEAPAFVSEYTSLRNCRTIEKAGPHDELANYFVDRCPGRDGSAILQIGTDSRTHLELQQGTTQTRLPTPETALYVPVVAGDKVEWRHRVGGAQRALVALIYRMAGNPREAYDRGDVQKMTSMLLVVRITGIGPCLLGQATTNESARQLADSDQQCR